MAAPTKDETKPGATKPKAPGASATPVAVLNHIKTLIGAMEPSKDPATAAKIDEIKAVFTAHEGTMAATNPHDD